jgi:uncharacterized protein YbaP (TraB family)
VYYQLADGNLRIAGSMHLIPAGQQLPMWVPQACQWSHRVFLEHDNDPSIFTLPLGTRASANVPVDMWKRIADLLSGQQFDDLKLWAICVRLAFRDPSGFAQGVEPFMRQFAVENGRAIEFLESPAEFATLLDAVDSSVIVSTMPPMLEEEAPRRNLKLINDMYEAWYQSDVASFDRVYLSTALMKIVELRAAMIDRRNENWLSKIESLVPSLQNTLIVVGAGHLAGDQGILSLLARRGIGSRLLA